MNLNLIYTLEVKRKILVTCLSPWVLRLIPIKRSGLGLNIAVTRKNNFNSPDFNPFFIANAKREYGSNILYD